MTATAPTLRFASATRRTTGSVFNRLIDRVRVHRHRVRQAEMLRARPDYLLDDIGITREDAEAAVFGD